MIVKTIIKMLTKIKVIKLIKVTVTVVQVPAAQVLSEAQVKS